MLLWSLNSDSKVLASEKGSIDKLNTNVTNYLIRIFLSFFILYFFPSLLEYIFHYFGVEGQGYQGGGQSAGG